MSRPFASRRAAPGSRAFLALVAALALRAAAGPSPVDGPPRVDRAKLDEAVRATLAKHEGRARAGLWLGGAAGEPLYASEPGRTLPTASAIKTAILVELFARSADALDRPVPGLDEILRDGHPAVAHFAPGQRVEIREGLAGVTVRRLGGIMMGSAPASNPVYNAAANVAIALLGGPEGATRSIRGRDPGFAPIVVNRYMLTDRAARGDNLATPEALAAVLRRLASREVPGVAPSTVEDIRRAVLIRDDPRGGRAFVKDGELTTDPITSVRTGWREGPGGPVVFVVMLALDGPGDRPRDAAYRDLAADADRLAGALLDAPARD